MKRKIVFIAIFLISVSSFAYSDTDVWYDGIATVSRFGEFPPSADLYYGASNSFDLNTFVTVVNTRNGKTVDVFIISKLGDEYISILLSSEASEVLAISEDEIIPIKFKQIFTPSEADEIIKELSVLATPEEIAEVIEPVIIPAPVVVPEEPIVEEIEPIVEEIEPIVEEIEPIVEKYILRRAEPKPPVVDVPVETIEVLEEPAKLSVGSYYVQLAAFKDFVSAEQQIASIKLDYPKFIYYDELAGIYKIMVGPLKNDEQGAALYNARNSGFKDAFVKKGE